jgi:hypothetical protein
MVKAEQHDTDRAGRLIFTETFLQLNWVPNQVSEDYGIDYNVQAFDRSEPTGAWFQVQLKSSLSLKSVESGQFISYTLDLEHLVHYSQESKQPVFLIFVNVPTREVYWACPLLDSPQISGAQLAGQETLTLRVPTSQILPSSAGKFIETLNRAYLILAARQLSETPVASFDAALRQRLFDESTLHGIQEKQDQIKLQKSADAFHNERYDEAEKRTKAMLDDLDTTLPGRFNALIQLNTIDFRRALFSGAQAIDIADVNFNYALRLRKLAGRQHRWIRFAAVLVHAAARVEKAVHLDAADFMALKIHAEVATNPIVTLGLLARRAANAREIARLYNRTLALLSLLSATPGAFQLGRLITRISTSIGPYLVALEFSASFETAKRFIGSALQVLDLSVELVRTAGDEQGITVAILAGLTLAHEEDSDAFRWANKTKTKISNPELSKEIDDLIDQTRMRWQGDTIDGDYNPDPIWQIFQKIARSLGIDISDENSPLVRRLRIAAADDSPEPWLKFCTHTVMSNGAISPIDVFIRQSFGVQTSPNKIAHCNLFDLHYEDTSGSRAFEKLNMKHCSSCSSRDPRPDQWEFTESARQLEKIENKDFMRKAESRGYGARFSLRDDLDPE